MKTQSSLSEQAQSLLRQLVNDALYTRARTLENQTGYISFYGRDPTSPTGVIRIGGCPLTDEYEEFIRSIDSSMCPLSLTER